MVVQNNSDFIIFQDTVNRESGMPRLGGSSILCDIMTSTKWNPTDE